MKPPPSSTVRNWLWPIIIALLAALIVIWLFSPLGDTPAEPAPQASPDPNWTTAPDGPAVPVQLPDTPVKVVPAEPGRPSPGPS